MDAEEFLRRRKDRACAIVLTVVDREVDGEVKERIRKVVLDQINDLYNATIDVVRSLDTGTVVLNELYLQKLDEISGLIRNGAR